MLNRYLIPARVAIWEPEHAGSARKLWRPEPLLVVDIALGITPAQECMAADLKGDGKVSIDERTRAVDRARNGC